MQSPAAMGRTPRGRDARWVESGIPGVEDGLPTCRGGPVSYAVRCGMHILVIEDERQLARHITSALIRHGHEAAPHYDGAEGLQAALSHPPDLIVLDLNLPGLDGLSVLARLREANSPARVLILTARGEVEHR